MTQIVKMVDLRGTFSKLEVGETVSIPFTYATETNIRSAASRFSKQNEVKLTVRAPLGSEMAVVKRVR